VFPILYCVERCHVGVFVTSPHCCLSVCCLTWLTCIALTIEVFTALLTPVILAAFLFARSSGWILVFCFFSQVPYLSWIFLVFLLVFSAQIVWLFVFRWRLWLCPHTVHNPRLASFRCSSCALEEIGFWSLSTAIPPASPPLCLPVLCLCFYCRK